MQNLPPPPLPHLPLFQWLCPRPTKATQSSSLTTSSHMHVHLPSVCPLMAVRFNTSVEVRPCLASPSTFPVSGFVGSLVFLDKQGWLGQQLIVCLSNSTGQGGVSYFSGRHLMSSPRIVHFLSECFEVLQTTGLIVLSLI